MNKKILFSIVGLVAAVAAYETFASDNVSTSSGVSRMLPSVRWSVTKIGAEANTPTASTTNIVSAVPGVVGKIVWIPGTIADTLAVYNSATAAGAVTTAKIFEANANSPTMGNSPTLALGSPVIWDLLPGWSATTGITTIIVRPNTGTGSKGYISWDNQR